ncbi:N-acetyl-gamma-glutamyl-phosphate reductase [Candidatus Nitrospira neomarina]|uniref:N-acetyl-gamma-glutamyl-phosphate reductase n=1 Tax=Candidatus Nitrospira neomarina TaxID=3020899 RepID=A0AA96GUQ7_9BACT|nr:N-acetyl-gamma-glutamyl-phosphate reductase [Candidatus Nitrospira neomarina]WNM63956.1 N-acetyl-gamma-glutamyl-phosphate reductase [Candidatus Nitrospira neomarina]
MDRKIRVAVIGASGYTGGELLRLLTLHPQVTLSRVVASEKSEGRAVASLLPHLTKIYDCALSSLNIDSIAKEVDVVFLALPHTQSLQPVADFLSQGKRVIDLSADYRLQDPMVYEQWYQTPHTFPGLLKNAVYGLPELNRAAIAKTNLVAVAGCYPTVAILQLAPFVAQNLIEHNSIIIDAKSGISGAGRTPALGTHFPESHEAIHAYKIGKHRHVPEIEQELARQIPASSSKTAFPNPSIIFTPHLIPINRGILSTAYAKLKPGIEQSHLDAAYNSRYRDEYFIRLFPSSEGVNPKNLRGSNFCDLSCTYDSRTGYLITTGSLDNLVKGAAGQAIQCMNLMLGLPETLGLTAPGLFP